MSLGGGLEDETEDSACAVEGGRLQEASGGTVAGNFEAGG